MAELMEAHTELKKFWGTLTGCWVSHDTRVQFIDYVRFWSDKTDIPVARSMPWLVLSLSKYHDWMQRVSKVNEHNAQLPRDHWLTDEEIVRICQFVRSHPLEGYRRMPFVMLDADVVACSPGPASVYRVLNKAELLTG